MGYFAITSNFVVILNLLVLTKKILRKIKTIWWKTKQKKNLTYFLFVNRKYIFFIKT